MKPVNKNNTPKSSAVPGRVRDAAQTRRRILAAATKLFLREAYENVGTRAIAAEAGVNATLINRYFGSKKGLFTEVIMSMGETLGSATPEELKEKLLQALAEILSEGPRGTRTARLRLLILSALSPDVSDIIADFFHKTGDSMANVFPGEPDTAKADLALASVLGVLMFFHILQNKKHRPEDIRAVQHSFSAMMDALFAETNP